MGWAIGFDSKWNRDIGYGVPAYCDARGCMEEIDRGLGYVCADSEPYGGDRGCGLYFCEKHRGYLSERAKVCRHVRRTTCRTDHPDWIHHKLTHPSWQEWRDSQSHAR